ncbi:30S ribosomal protein S20 [Candidatus Odyssella acanthamoebae]|uniref:Small ribosomal subunit protein bS20 n=1 Tax=Candidatus Odyssella acanthamoebae TaxID=91604 RepID=A0A077B127_9PROT|nr:30S ribosomal protein S20 [Candidatus Paracaedibacter acanthamoebae]AIK96650.1 30S ribosomal protein S20 [Candidatus Paracaedibacter acanthamoebae]
MANHRNAEKAARQTERRTKVNRDRVGRIRTFLRKVEEAISSGSKETATAAIRVAEGEIMRGVTKGVIHKNTASRKVSRLTKRVKAIA